MDGDKRSLLRWAGTVGGLTFVSRVLGLIRDMLTSSAFGTGKAFSDFELAFRVPNLFRSLFGEGALNAAFTPMFKEHVERGDMGCTAKFFNATATLLSIVLAGIVVLGYLVSVGLRCYFHWSGQPGILFCNLLDIMMPYLFLVCLTAFLSSVQNALEQFAVPALASALLNLCWIAGVLLVFVFPQLGIYAVAVGVLVSGFLQLAMQGASVRAKGLKFRFDPDWKYPEILKMVGIMWPVVIGLGVSQINFLLDGVIAKFLVPEVGGNAVLFYSNRLMQFPLGVVAIAMGTAVLPLLSKYAARGDRENFVGAMNHALRTTFFVSIPAAALIMVLARPIVDLVYARGEFGPDSASRTTAALVFYTAGLWAYCGLQIVTRAFYSLQDTRTPMKIALWRVGMNLALNLTLVWPLWEGGLALSSAITASVALIVQIYMLQGRLGPVGIRALMSSAGKICAITGVMCLVALVTLLAVPHLPLGSGTLHKLGRVFLPMGTGGVAFIATCIVVRPQEWCELLDAFLRRRKTTVSVSTEKG